MGSPFQVLVEPNQAFAPATLVWWDRQVGPRLTSTYFSAPFANS